MPRIQWKVPEGFQSVYGSGKAEDSPNSSSSKTKVQRAPSCFCEDCDSLRNSLGGEAVTHPRRNRCHIQRRPQRVSTGGLRTGTKHWLSFRGRPDASIFTKYWVDLEGYCVTVLGTLHKLRLLVGTCQDLRNEVCVRGLEQKKCVNFETFRGRKFQVWYFTTLTFLTKGLTGSELERISMTPKHTCPSHLFCRGPSGLCFGTNPVYHKSVTRVCKRFDYPVCAEERPKIPTKVCVGLVHNYRNRVDDTFLKSIRSRFFWAWFVSVSSTWIT